MTVPKKGNGVLVETHEEDEFEGPEAEDEMQAAVSTVRESLAALPRFVETSVA